MPTYTKVKLEQQGESNRMKLAGEVVKLESAGADVPPALRSASAKKQLSTETLTAAIIELTGRVLELEALEARASALEEKVATLEAFHP